MAHKPMILLERTCTLHNGGHKSREFALIWKSFDYSIAYPNWIMPFVPDILQKRLQRNGKAIEVAFFKRPVTLGETLGSLFGNRLEQNA